MKKINKGNGKDNYSELLKKAKYVYGDYHSFQIHKAKIAYEVEFYFTLNREFLSEKDFERACELVSLVDYENSLRNIGIRIKFIVQTLFVLTKTIGLSLKNITKERLFHEVMLFKTKSYYAHSYGITEKEYERFKKGNICQMLLKNVLCPKIGDIFKLKIEKGWEGLKEDFFFDPENYIVTRVSKKPDGKYLIKFKKIERKEKQDDIR